MKHVRVRLDAGGREAEIHPVYDIVVNAPYVERATAIQWNVSSDELGILHFVEGDREAFESAIETVSEVRDYDIVSAGSEAFYVYIQDRTTDAARELFEIVTRPPLIVVPPIEYGSDGTVSYSVFGPSAAIQSSIDRIPDPVSAEIASVGGFGTVPGVLESLLSDRQREALEAALDLGYYEIPREAGHEAVAAAIDCAPSTAAEHLRKAEHKLLGSILEG